jgi:hypothetical protein
MLHLFVEHVRGHAPELQRVEATQAAETGSGATHTARDAKRAVSAAGTSQRLAR